jgi:hypothetical protein
LNLRRTTTAKTSRRVNAGAHIEGAETNGRRRKTSGDGFIYKICR